MPPFRIVLACAIAAVLVCAALSRGTQKFFGRLPSLGVRSAHDSTEWKDFGRSEIFRHDRFEYRWEPVPFFVEEAPPRSRKSQEGSPVRLFANPISEVRLRTKGQGTCDNDTFLVRVRDHANATYRLVAQGVTEGRWCLVPFLAWNLNERRSLTVFRLRKTTIEPGATPFLPRAAGLIGTAVEAALTFTWLRPPSSNLVYAARTEGHGASPLEDFRFVRYTFDPTAVPPALVSLVSRAKQSLVMVSATMANGTGGPLRALYAISPQFPVYIVLRSPLAHDEVRYRFVLHAKAFSLDRRSAEISSAPLTVQTYVPLDYSVRFSDTSTVEEVRQSILAMLDRTLPPARGSVAQGRAVPFQSMEHSLQLAVPEGPRRALEEVRKAKRSIVISFYGTVHPELWKAIRESDARDVVILVNYAHAIDLRPDGDSVQRIDPKSLNQLIARPGRKVRWVAAEFGEEPAVRASAVVHVRSFFVDTAPCALSDSTLSPFGSYHSDSLTWWQTSPQRCQNIRKEFLGLLWSAAESYRRTGESLTNRTLASVLRPTDRVLPPIRLFNLETNKELSDTERAELRPLLLGDTD